ncbi:MAG: glucans biosynthesis protein [Aquabacterium sp.]|nr:MAG: glucans biosynthesis protein [Aquabacterium sp.]
MEQLASPPIAQTPAGSRTRIRPSWLLGLLALGSAAGSHAADTIDFEAVAAQAQALAARPHDPHTPQAPVPAELAALNYDQTRDIRFKPARALWRADKLPFELMFFHLGGHHQAPVHVSELLPGGRPRELAYDAADFDYGRNRLDPKAWGDIGHAGWRVHYAINRPGYKDEVAVFQGASYFRGIGRDQHYGLSARGLAIDTVGAGAEEFPRFTRFWIERPAKNAEALVVLALLESPRATGAWRFVIRPGRETLMEVRMRLFLRQGVATLGIAPLTSMFLAGENQPAVAGYRPEVHDSDGLLVATAGTDGKPDEWLWRPLVNPGTTLASSFAMNRLHGFGLMQRDRVFSSYEDTEARYDKRPSAWVEPVGDWGPGRVELVQLNTADETFDNIVAYWVPRQAPEPGKPLELSYRLHWQGTQEQRPPKGWTVQTRSGRGYGDLPADQQQYVVDFAGPALDKLPAGTPVQAVASAAPGSEIVDRNVFKNDATGTWRMTLRIRRNDLNRPVELRAYLQNGQDKLTETWTPLTAPR